ncbi:MAG: hypothetical protein WCE63_16375 [Acidobacteriaceae bacterium]
MKHPWSLSPNAATERRPGQLNDPQQRHLRVSCQYIDRLLSDIESVLHVAASKSPFPRYVVDIRPAQSGVIEEHIHRMRSQLMCTLAWQHMEPQPPEIPVTCAVMTDLSFVEIAIEEMRPSHMLGYGVVPEDAVGELNGVIDELRSLVEGMQRYVREELDGNVDSHAGG